MAKAHPLATYNAKRDFSKTAEPAGEFAPGNGHSFMVQKHDATRLHWDFRLELDVWSAVVEPERLDAGWWAPPDSLEGEALPSLFRKVLAEAGFR